MGEAQKQKLEALKTQQLKSTQAIKRYEDLIKAELKTLEKVNRELAELEKKK